MKIGEKIYKGTTVLEALCGVPGGVDFATKRRGVAAKLKLSVLQSCSLNETSLMACPTMSRTRDLKVQSLCFVYSFNGKCVTVVDL